MPTPDQLDALLAELAGEDPAGSQTRKAALAQEWAKVASLIRQSEGNTPRLADALAIAADLDPQNESLAREAAREKRRQEIIQSRLARAERTRAEPATRND